MLIILTISDDGDSIIYKIYDKHHERMLYTAKCILGADRAEDAVHDVILKLIEKINAHNDKKLENLGDKPSLFFVILVRNHSIDLLRKEKVTLPLFDEEDENDDVLRETVASPEDVLLENEAADSFVSLIRRLKPAARQLLEYKYIAEYSNKEIASILGISQTAVSTRIDKAKKRLRDIIESEGA